MTATVQSCLWPTARRDELAARLAGAARIAVPGPGERFELAYRDVAPGLGKRARDLAPALLRVGDGAGALLGVVGYSGARAQLLAPDGRTFAVDVAALAAHLRAPAEATARATFDDTVGRAGLSGPRARAVADALLVANLGGERVADGTRLRPAVPSIRAALWAAGLGRRAGIAVIGYLAQLALFSGLWWMVGARAVAAADAGRGLVPGWIAGLAAVIAMLVAVRLISSWAAGRLAIDVGETLRDRLLHGLLALETEPIRAEGIGQLLGRVVETEALESLALGGGLIAAAGAFELVAGAAVLGFGLTAGSHLGLLLVWAAVAIALGARVARLLARWSAQRLSLTHDLVERMVGQRTLVAQQPPELRHREEDVALDAYAQVGSKLDRALADLAIVVPRGWLVASVVVLAPQLPEMATRPGAFAVSIGGLLLVYGALRKLAQAFPALVSAVLAWRNVELLFAPGAGDKGAQRPTSEAVVDTAASDMPLIVARDVSFGYPGRSASVISGCGFEIRRGDRILLEGPSGGGKSTLGAILAGLRIPDSGQLALLGREQTELGIARWRARVAAAPQFHENHVFSASLLFNLLLGRGWPPRREDVVEAEAVLRELDLGPLLARMPSGLEQLVGESGWQLSHGERSRLYIARSLLQPLDARILDESFAALDPETLERALACVLKRAETLVVIAHP